LLFNYDLYARKQQSDPNIDLIILSIKAGNIYVHDIYISWKCVSQSVNT